MSRLGHPLAWLTLAWTDAAPGRLLTYLEAALAKPVARAAGVATGALAARIPHAEAAGLLVEAVGDEPVVLVIDELERIAESTEAWATDSTSASSGPPVSAGRGGGRLLEARQLVADVLRAEPLREAAWRLTMRLASALGDEDGVLRAYRRCEQALAAVGATPAPTTRQLLEQLRRS